MYVCVCRQSNGRVWVLIYIHIMRIICQKRRFNTLVVWKLLTNYEWIGCLITSGCWLPKVPKKALQHSGCQQFGSFTEVSTTFLLQAAMNRLEMCEKWWSEEGIYKSYTSWHYLLHQVNNALIKDLTSDYSFRLLYQHACVCYTAAASFTYWVSLIPIPVQKPVLKVSLGTGNSAFFLAAVQWFMNSIHISKHRRIRQQQANF